MFECPICFQNRRKITTLQCKHRICTFCWEQWKLKGRKHTQLSVCCYKTSLSCPFCRAIEPMAHRQCTRDEQLICVMIFVFIFALHLYDII